MEAPSCETPMTDSSTLKGQLEDSPPRTTMTMPNPYRSRPSRTLARLCSDLSHRRDTDIPCLLTPSRIQDL